MRILMTGPTGLVGSRLGELLSPKHRIVELREEDGFDVVDRSCVERALDVCADAVVHLAAFTDVSAAWKQRHSYEGSCYRVNVLGTQNIAQVCAERRIYLVHVSTDFVFDGRKGQPYSEMDQPSPVEWYGRTKLWAEGRVQRSGVRAAIIRIAYPFRAYFPPKLDLVRWILKGLKEGTLPPMVSDQWITLTFIDDLAPVIDHFVTYQPEGIFHAVGSGVITPYVLAREIARLWGFNPEGVREGSLADLLRIDKRPRQRHLYLYNGKLQRLGLTMSELPTALRTVKAQMEGVEYEIG